MAFTHRLDRLMIITFIVNVRVFDEYLNGVGRESNPNMRDDEYLKWFCSHILFWDHYLSQLTAHNDPRVNHPNFAFTAAQLIQDPASL